MKRVLIRIKHKIYYYRNNKEILGVHEDIRGDESGISGDVSRISGDIDDCEISDEERKRGIKIEELIKEEENEKPFRRLPEHT